MAVALGTKPAWGIDCSYRQDTKVLKDVFGSAKRDRCSTDKVERRLGVEVASRFPRALWRSAGKSEMRGGVIGNGSVVLSTFELPDMFFDVQLGKMCSE